MICSFVETPVFSDHTKDVRIQKQAQLKAKKDAEKAIINLSERERAAKVQGKQEGHVNLFLVPPEIEAEQDRRCTFFHTGIL